MITRLINRATGFGVQIPSPQTTSQIAMIMLRKCPGVTLSYPIDEERLSIGIATPHLLARSRLLSGVLAFSQARNDRERKSIRDTTTDKMVYGRVLKRVFRNRNAYRYEITGAGATLTVRDVEPVIRAIILAELYNVLRAPSLPELMTYSFQWWTLAWASLGTDDVPDRLRDLATWLSTMRTEIALSIQPGNGLTSPGEAERVLLSLIERNGAIVVDREEDQLRVPIDALAPLLSGEVHHYGEPSLERHMITAYLREHQQEYIRIDPERAVIDLRALRQLPAQHRDPHRRPRHDDWLVCELLAKIYGRLGLTEGIGVWLITEGGPKALIMHHNQTLPAPAEVDALLSTWQTIVGRLPTMRY